MTALMHGGQIARFGLVGILATAVHGASFVLLVEGAHVRALVASILAFCIALGVSYTGHRRWTFRDSRSTPVGSFLRFTATAVFGLVVSAGATYLIVDMAGASYLYALVFVVVAMPITTYVLSRLWVFT